MSKELLDRWKPAEWVKFDAYCMQAMARGEATAEQQQHALKVIVEKLAGTYEQSFVVRESDTTAFLEGRRSVGLQIVKLIKVDLALIKDKSAQLGKY